MAEPGKLTAGPASASSRAGPARPTRAIGVHTAFQDSTPMILFIGQVASDLRDREAFQEIDYRQMFGPARSDGQVGRRRSTRADRMPEYVARAFHVAMQGRPGPGGAGAARGHADARRPPSPVLPRVEPAQAWPAPGALRELRTMLLAGASGRCVIARRQRLDARGVRRAAALRRELAAAGRLRVPLPGPVRQPPSATTSATSASASTRSSPQRVREADLISPSARAWAR